MSGTATSSVPRSSPKRRQTSSSFPAAVCGRRAGYRSAGLRFSRGSLRAFLSSASAGGVAAMLRPRAATREHAARELRHRFEIRARRHHRRNTQPRERRRRGGSDRHHRLEPAQPIGPERPHQRARRGRARHDDRIGGGRSPGRDDLAHRTLERAIGDDLGRAFFLQYLWAFRSQAGFVVALAGRSGAAEGRVIQGLATVLVTNAVLLAAAAALLRTWKTPPGRST